MAYFNGQPVPPGFLSPMFNIPTQPYLQSPPLSPRNSGPAFNVPQSTFLHAGSPPVPTWTYYGASQSPDSRHSYLSGATSIKVTNSDGKISEILHSNRQSSTSSASPHRKHGTASPRSPAVSPRNPSDTRPSTQSPAMSSRPAPNKSDVKVNTDKKDLSPSHRPDPRHSSSSPIVSPRRKTSPSQRQTTKADDVKTDSEVQVPQQPRTVIKTIHVPVEIAVPVEKARSTIPHLL